MKGQSLGLPVLYRIKEKAEGENWVNNNGKHSHFQHAFGSYNNINSYLEGSYPVTFCYTRITKSDACTAQDYV